MSIFVSIARSRTTSSNHDAAGANKSSEAEHGAYLTRRTPAFGDARGFACSMSTARRGPFPPVSSKAALLRGDPPLFGHAPWPGRLPSATVWRFRGSWSGVTGSGRRLFDLNHGVYTSCRTMTLETGPRSLAVYDNLPGGVGSGFRERSGGARRYRKASGPLRRGPRSTGDHFLHARPCDPMRF